MRDTTEDRVEGWSRFIEKETKGDWGEDTFLKAARRRLEDSPISGTDILTAWTSLRPPFRRVDPFLMRKFELLSYSHLFTDVDVLVYVRRHIRDVLSNLDSYVYKPDKVKGEWTETVEAAMLERSAWRMVNLRHENVKAGDRVPDARICKPLIQLVATFTECAEGLGAIQGPALEIGTELGKFIAAYMNDLNIVGLLTIDNGHPPKPFRRLFGEHLPRFINLMSNVHAELASTLSSLQAQSGLLDLPAPEHIDEDLANNIDALSYQESVIDTPLVPSRAALYIFLNAMLTGRPVCDDAALTAFLNARYGENVPALLVDLVVAAFDALGNAANRNEPAAALNVCRSFVANKLPVLLEFYAHLVFPPLTVEACVTDALGRLDLAGDSYANAPVGSFDLLGKSGMLNEAKQDFLFACALFKLIPESSIETILGDVPIQDIPADGKYAKMSLVEQCSANPNRIEELVMELENMQGNSGEIAAALVEVRLPVEERGQTKLHARSSRPCAYPKIP